MIKSKLVAIKQVFQQASSFESAWDAIQADLLTFFQVEQLRIYKKDPDKEELFAILVKDGRPCEIRLSFSSASIAGYTAMTQAPLALKSLDTNALEQISEDLKYDLQFEKLTGIETRSLLSFPIHFEGKLMGVLQLANKKNDTFNREDEAFGRLIGNIMGQKLQEESARPTGPYENLIYKGVITREKFVEAQGLAVKRKMSLSRILRSEYEIRASDIGASLEMYYQVPYVPFENNPVSEHMLKSINRQYLINNQWVPIQSKGDHVVVLLPNPGDAEKLEEIRRILSAKSYEFRVGLPEDILAFLGDTTQLPKNTHEENALRNERQGADAVEDDEEVEEVHDDDDGEDLADAFADLEDAADEGIEIGQVEEEDISQESRQLAVRFVNKIIMHAYKTGASDIHIEPSKSGRPGVVRMRIDGSCQKVLSVPESIIKPVISRIKIISNLNISEKRLPQDGKAKVRFKGRELELRVATLPTVHGECAVLRMLASGRALPFDKLNLTERNKQQIEHLMVKPHGLLLVVGPTGSGKTTTLHSVLSRINTPDKKIWTVEDPVEITQPGLQQVQVEGAYGLNFARIMRSFLRADPDVILVGEMRDLETAQIGVEASLTGHMVFSTLHTNSAAETVTRLLDIGVEVFNFAEALQGVLAQRLVKTLCQNCRESYVPEDEEWNYLVGQYGEDVFPELGFNRDGLVLYRARGCVKCGRTGYKGRTGVHEMLTATPEIKKAIVQRRTAEEINTIASRQGMRTLYQDGIYKIFKGDIDILQLQKVTVAD